MKWFFTIEPNDDLDKERVKTLLIEADGSI